MKRCAKCGRAYSDLVTTCSYCGSALTGNAGANPTPKPPVQPTYTSPVKPTPPPVQQNHKPTTPPAQPARPVTPPTRPATAPVQPNPVPVKPTTSGTSENVGTGILGALIFGLGGAVVQAVILNMGKVAAISGIICFLLAMYGYKKFSGIGDGPSKAAPWVGAVVSLGMIFLGTVAGYAVYIANQIGVGIGEALGLLFEEAELIEAMGSDMGMSAVLWGIALVTSLVSSRKKK